MAEGVYTQTDRRAVAVGGADTWTVDFDAAIVGSDPITVGGASLMRVNAAHDGTVSGFVADVNVSGESVLVRWDGAVLVRGAWYELRTTATLTSGAVLTAVTPLEAV